MKREGSTSDAATITVAIADDQAIVRRGIRLMVDAEPDLEVVGEAADGIEAIALARVTRPDVLLMDVRMPRLDGLAATVQIRADPQLGGTRVVVLTTFDDDECVDRALEAGALGYVVKDSEPDEILRSIRAVAAGQAWLDPAVTAGVMRRYAATDRNLSPGARSDVQAATNFGEGALAALTPREVDVLRLVAEGMSNAEIADALVISHATARTHVGRILQKFGARDRAQLVVAAFRSGLVTPGTAAPRTVTPGIDDRGPRA